MKKVLIDSSVLFSACRSSIGNPALLMTYCRRGVIEGYVSSDVIVEVKRNVAAENSNVKKRLNMFILQSKLKVIIPTQEQIIHCSQAINVKDAHVLAAAIKCRAGYLITLDKKDFMQPKVREFVKPMKILTPKKFLKEEGLL